MVNITKKNYFETIKYACYFLQVLKEFNVFSAKIKKNNNI